MPVKITCPHCSLVHRFSQPYPLPGSEVQCACGKVLVISFPPDMMTKLRASGASFSDPLAPPSGADQSPYPPAPPPALPRRRGLAADGPPDPTGPQGDPT